MPFAILVVGGGVFAGFGVESGSGCDSVVAYAKCECLAFCVNVLELGGIVDVPEIGEIVFVVGNGHIFAIALN